MKKRLIIIYIFVGIIISSLILSCNSDRTHTPAVGIEGDYLCISLTTYLTKLGAIINSGETIPEDMNNLYGMSWLEGFVLNREINDIILVGKRDISRPTLHAEDLFINFQNVLDSATAPYCSLDPLPEKVKQLEQVLNDRAADFEQTIIRARAAIGDQMVLIGGVPLNSRHAKIMIYADYDMKKISQGSLKVPGIRSCIDIVKSDTVEELKDEPTMSRFWLHIKENKSGEVYPSFLESDGIVFIDKCPVVVLTESQISDKFGNLRDDSLKDITARTFASEMSHSYNILSREVPLFAELENLFRLQACIRAMQYKQAFEVTRFDLELILGFYLRPGNNIEESLPGLVNYAITQKVTPNQKGELTEQKLFIVAGGVSQDMTIGSKNFIKDRLMRATHLTILHSQISSDTTHWRVRDSRETETHSAHGHAHDSTHEENHHTPNEEDHE